MTEQSERGPDFDPTSLQQWWPKPSRPRPIVVFVPAASSVMRICPPTGRPVFRLPGSTIRIGKRRARRRLGGAWTPLLPSRTLLAVEGAIFDLATPPAAHAHILRALPEGASVLIQKLDGSGSRCRDRILDLCRKHTLQAA